MNIKRVVKYLELKSQLTAEELQMAETMVGLTESDKEALAGLLQPVKAKSKPTLATKRVIEKCLAAGCGLTRRAVVHKDSNARGHHAFLSAADDNEDHCWFAIPSLNGKICGADINNPIHHDQVIKTYHEFQPTQKLSAKSKRASSLASAISGTASRNVSSGQPQLCTFSIDGKVCHGLENDGIHDKTMGYGGYHEFQPAVAQAASGD